MKKVLALTPKFNKLSEAKSAQKRFILHEKANTNFFSASKVNKILDRINKMLPILDEFLNEADKLSGKSSITSNQITTLKNALTTIEAQAKNTQDPAIIKAKTIEFISTVQDIIDILAEATDKTAKNVFDNLQGIKKLTQSDFTQNTSQVLLNYISSILGAINELNLETASKQGETAGTLKNTKLIVLQAKTILSMLLDSSPAKVNVVDEMMLNDKKLVEDLNKLADLALDKAHNLHNFIIANTGAEYFNNKWTSTLQAIINNTNISDREKEKALDAAKRNANSTEDWKARFEASGPNKTAFWEDYYKSAWGDDSGRIKSFGLAFQQECERLGFTEISNPFIYFLKKYLHVFALDSKNYTVLHDAVANGIGVDKADLAGTAEFHEINLIYCKDFYTKSPDMMKQLLTLQHNARRTSPDKLAAVAKGDAKKVKAALNILISKGKTGREFGATFAYYILYKDANILSIPRELDKVGTFTINDYTVANDLYKGTIAEGSGVTQGIWTDKTAGDIYDFIKRYPASEQTGIAIRIMYSLGMRFSEAAAKIAGLFPADVKTFAPTQINETRLSEVNDKINRSAISASAANAIKFATEYKVNAKAENLPELK